MKKLFLAIALVLFLAGSVWAGDYGYNRNDAQKYPYKSYSGQRYQYDLSRPGDRLRYQVDPGAQLNDRLFTPPTVKMDRNMGQYGGGWKR